MGDFLGSVIIYFMIGGVFVGSIGNDIAEDCGALTNTQIHELLDAAVIWPAVMLFSAVIDDEAISDSECKWKAE